jgi:hypothetical protein
MNDQIAFMPKIKIPTEMIFRAGSEIVNCNPPAECA